VEQWLRDAQSSDVSLAAPSRIANRLTSFVRIREDVVTRKINTDQSPFSEAAKTGTAASAPWRLIAVHKSAVKGTEVRFGDLLSNGGKQKSQEPLIPEPSPRLSMWFAIGGILVAVAAAVVQFAISPS
jgi:hypothetical protein